MDVALRNAQARRAEVVAKLEAAQQQVQIFGTALADIDRFIRDWHRFAGTNLKLSDPEPVLKGTLDRIIDQHEATEVRRTRVTGNPRKEEVAEAARAIITERGEPVSRPDLYKALLERGVVVRGTDPEKTLSTMLWRTEGQIVRVRGGGYWLADVPYEAAGYDPKTDDKEHRRRVEANLISLDGQPIPPDDDDILGAELNSGDDR